MNIPFGRWPAVCCHVFTCCGIVEVACVDRLEMGLAFEICCGLESAYSAQANSVHWAKLGCRSGTLVVTSRKF